MSLSCVRTMSLYEVKLAGSAPPPPPPPRTRLNFVIYLPTPISRLYDIRRMQSDDFIVEEQCTEHLYAHVTGVLIVIIFIMGPEGGGVRTPMTPSLDPPLTWLATWINHVTTVSPKNCAVIFDCRRGLICGDRLFVLVSSSVVLAIFYKGSPWLLLALAIR